MGVQVRLSKNYRWPIVCSTITILKIPLCSFFVILTRLLSCILKKVWCINQHCHLYIFYNITDKYIFWYNDFISIAIINSFQESQFGLFRVFLFVCLFVWFFVLFFVFVLFLFNLVYSVFLSFLSVTSTFPTFNGILKFYWLNR
jgi:hypothetical protein